MTKMKLKAFLTNGSVNEDRLRLLCSFLDVSKVLGRIQWKFQKSQITIMDVPHAKDIAVTELKLILSKPKPDNYNIA